MSSRLIPTAVTFKPQSDPDDVRFGTFISKTNLSLLPETSRVAILGFPTDVGVERNGGRPGASRAPDEIRKYLYKLTPDASHFAECCELLKTVVDLGNIECSRNLEQDQEHLAFVVAELLKKNIVPIVLGGGHETGYGHFLGYANNQTKVNILNIDAHTDVRPLKDNQAHSGSPFRQALLHASAGCAHYKVMGLNPYTVAVVHLEFMKQHNGSFEFQSFSDKEVQDYFAKTTGDIMVTLDMDAVDQAYAPGVSAPNAYGITPQQWLMVAQTAGVCAKVKSLDICEVNPLFDSDGHTARLAALTIAHFMAGLQKRLRND